MLNKNEIKILEKLIENMALDSTLLSLSKKLNQTYSQTHRSIQALSGKNLIKIKKIGKSNVIKLDFSRYHSEYAFAEIERLNEILRIKDISLVFDEILNIEGQFACILFGSYASGNFKKGSDMDLLFIVPDECNTSRFERRARNTLSVYNVDINVVSEKSLFEMWANPGKLNVGNELLKGHIVLHGSEIFINLMRRHYVGR